MSFFRVFGTALLSTACIVSSATAAADSTTFELSAYGTLLYEHYNYGADQKSFPDGSQPDSRSIVDVNKIVIEAEYHFSPQTELELELEIEHGGTGSAMELEYEEFGEYENEVEKGGEVILEDVYIKHKFDDSWSIKGGHFVIPVGFANRNTAPFNYFGVRSHEGEQQVLPYSWHETGVELGYKQESFAIVAGVVNGLNSTGFSSQNWIAGGHQTRFEYVKATDLAVYTHIHVDVHNSLAVDASVYAGNTTNNRPKNDMEGISGQVVIVEGSAQFEQDGLTVRVGGMLGSLSNSDQISAKNQRLSAALEVPRTPVAEGAMYMFAELGYDIGTVVGLDQPLYVYGIYESFNAMHATVAAMNPNARFERAVYQGGVVYAANEFIGIKGEFRHREIGGGTYNSEQTIALGLCFDTQLFSL